MLVNENNYLLPILHHVGWQAPIYNNSDVGNVNAKANGYGGQQNTNARIIGREICQDSALVILWSGRVKHVYQSGINESNKEIFKYQVHVL